MEGLEDLANKFGANERYNTLTSYQIKFLTDISVSKKDVKIEINEAGKHTILSVIDTYNGKDEQLSAKVYGIIRLPEYKVAAKDFNPKQTLGSLNSYLFTLKDKSKIKVEFKSEKNIKSF